MGCEQNRYHAFDVWKHSMECLDACEGDPPLRIAALLHDIGKPKTREKSEKTNDYTFYNHEKVGADMAGPILERLRFSNEERERITLLVRNHLVCYSDDWNDAAVRRWIRRVTRDRVEDLYALNRADVLGKGRDVTTDLEALEKLKARVAGVLAAKDALSVRELTVDGKDVMRELVDRPEPPRRRSAGGTARESGGGSLAERSRETARPDSATGERLRLRDAYFLGSLAATLLSSSSDETPSS